MWGRNKYWAWILSSTSQQTCFHAEILVFHIYLKLLSLPKLNNVSSLNPPRRACIWLWELGKEYSYWGKATVWYLAGYLGESADELVPLQKHPPYYFMHPKLLSHLSSKTSIIISYIPPAWSEQFLLCDLSEYDFCAPRKVWIIPPLWYLFICLISHTRPFGYQVRFISNSSQALQVKRRNRKRTISMYR